MKYCTNCGKELADAAYMCPNCGKIAEDAKAKEEAKSGSNSMRSIAKIFMILGCVLNGLYLIPLIWAIPMTIHYCKAVNENRPVGAGFKVCTLLFVSLIAGIMMFFDND